VVDLCVLKTFLPLISIISPVGWAVSNQILNRLIAFIVYLPQILELFSQLKADSKISIFS
jgi:hypothetical protein